MTGASQQQLSKRQRSMTRATKGGSDRLRLRRGDAVEARPRGEWGWAEGIEKSVAALPSSDGRCRCVVVESSSRRVCRDVKGFEKDRGLL